jgi:lactate dehydrogenase-like 2-hydroxyacid dehydrogenase
VKDVHILMLAKARPQTVDALAGRFTLHKAWERPDREANLRQIGADIRGLVPGPGAQVDAALLDLLPNLEVVAADGVEGIDLKEAARRGVVVTDGGDEAADRAVGLLLAVVRQLPQVDRYLRAGEWLKKPYALTATLRGRKIGILGQGTLGRAIGKRLEAFGVEVASGGRESPEALAQTNDVLVVTPEAPAGAVDAAVLKALGPDGIVVDVSGGSAVDEAALVAALGAKTILTAALEVSKTAPPALAAMEHVVFYPRRGDSITESLEAWFSGKGPVSPRPETPFKGTALA